MSSRRCSFRAATSARWRSTARSTMSPWRARGRCIFGSLCAGGRLSARRSRPHRRQHGARVPRGGRARRHRRHEGGREGQRRRRFHHHDGHRGCAGRASISRETEPSPAMPSSSAARLAITESRCSRNAKTSVSKPRSCRTAPPFMASLRTWWRRCPPFTACATRHAAASARH